MFSNNIPQVKVGMIAVSRDCFPLSVSKNRAERVFKECKKRNIDLFLAPTVVENENDALSALEEVKSAFSNALVVFLGNFGPETPETLLAKYFDGPVMYVAAAEETGDDLVGGRGDAYCGMLNASYNLGLRKLNAYIPDYPVGTPDEVASMIDEFIPIARTIIGLKDLKIISLNRRVAAVEGRPDILSLDKEYTHAMYGKSLSEGRPQYPDANSTMRITYGTVGDIRPYDAVTWSWRSTASGVLEKYDPSSYEFRLEDRQRELLEAEDWGRWAAKDGSMYVNFLTDNDITGGNSGSPVMNAKGELIGLAFDGNKESLASDVYYVDGYTKCVCVDIRYVLWVLEYYAGMDHILEEIGI